MVSMDPYSELGLISVLAMLTRIRYRWITKVQLLQLMLSPGPMRANLCRSVAKSNTSNGSRR